MLVAKSLFDKAGCEYEGLEGNGALFITLGSHKYP
jgi:hypothetical protein